MTKEELALHRPDLPLSIAQCGRFEWKDGIAVKTVTELADRLARLECLDVDGSSAKLDIAELYLYPFGPDGGQKAGVRVKAANGDSFTPQEVAFKALEIQARHLGDQVPTSGIGIYRSGLQRGLPAYYLWGGHSKLP